MNGPTFATPRSTAPAAAARPPASRPPRPGVKLDADANNGLRVLTYLRLHWLMILFCGSLLGSALAYAAWALLPSKYESYALMRVSSVPTQIANPNNPNQARTEFTTYLKTTAALLKSEFVLNAALRDLREVQTLKDQREPIKFLEEEVLVNWQEGSEIVRITFKGHNPGDTRKVVDAIQTAFLSEVVMTEVQEKQQFRDKVQEAKLDMQKILESRAKAANPPGVIPINGQAGAGKVVSAAGTPPGLLPLPGAESLPVGLNPVPVPQAGLSADELLRKLDPRLVIQELASLSREVERLPLQIDDAKRRLGSVVARIELVRKAAADPLMIQAVEKDEDVIRMMMRAAAAKRKYDTMAGSGDPNAPGVLRLRGDWQADEATLEKLRKAKLDALENGRRTQELQKLYAEGDVAQREVQRLLDQQKVAQTQLAKSEKLIREIKTPEVVQMGGREQPETVYSPEDTVRNTDDSVLASLVRQFRLTDMELQSPPRVRPLQKASQPTQKDLKKQILATVAAGFMGFALIALGVVAFETMARKVSSLSDLKSVGPAPVVGVIPCVPNQATGRDPAKRAAANEAIDKLRSYVSQTWLARGATTVAVTSATGDEGKAFTAFGLASSLAQSGCRTLLVDFDLRTPSLHAYAGVPNQVGICDLLRGEAEPQAAIQILPNGLHLLPSGCWSDDARKSAVGGKLDALLTRLKEPFDCLVLHGHALLTAAESVEVARRCEVVLVCALYRETKGPLLRKATDRVAAMEIPYSGVVYVGASESEALC